MLPEIFAAFPGSGEDLRWDFLGIYYHVLAPLDMFTGFSGRGAIFPPG